MEESELLRRFVRENSAEAFRELVGREMGLVYSAALRQVGGDPHRAAEVTQAVFTALAAKAGQVVHHPSLSGWLYTSTRFAAGALLRAERRRQQHEQEASHMHPPRQDPPPSDTVPWREIAQVLDEAVHDLRAADRDAVLLRYFEGHTLERVGQRLGLSEDAARKRIDRALESLRAKLQRRGIVCAAAALSHGLAQGAIATAPAGLALGSANVALTAAAAGAVSTVGVSLFAMNKAMLASAGLVAAVGLGSAYYITQSPSTNPPASSVFVPPSATPERAAPPVAPSPVSANPGTASASPPQAAELDEAAQLAKERAEMVAIARERAEMAARASQAAEAAIELNANGPVPPSVNAAAIGALKDAPDALAYFRGIAADDLFAQLQYLFTLPNGDGKTLLMTALFHAWAERDAPGAMAAAAKGGDRVVRWAYEGWARTDLEAAWLQASSPPITGNRVAVISGAVQAGRAAQVADWLVVPVAAPPEGEAEGYELMNHWGLKDPAAAAQWLKRFEVVNPYAAGMVASALGRTAAGLPLSEFSPLISDQSERVANLALASAVRQWVANNQLDKVREFAASNPRMSDARHDLVFSSMGMTLMREDPDLALRTLLEMRIPAERDRYLGMAAMDSGPAFTAEKGMEIALAIGDSIQRLNRTRQVYERWLAKDAVQARAFIARESFPADLRTRLEPLATPPAP